MLAHKLFLVRFGCGLAAGVAEAVLVVIRTEMLKDGWRPLQKYLTNIYRKLFVGENDQWPEEECSQV